MKKFIVILLLLIFGILVLYNGEKILFPVKYKDSVLKYSREFNLEPELVLSIMKAESSFSKDAKSHKNAIGLMQLIYDTAESGARELKIENFSEEKLWEPDINIRIGCWHIRKLINEHSTMFVVIASYNAGGKKVRNWIENTDYKRQNPEEFSKNLKYVETRKFFNRVINNYNIYKKIYKGNMEV